MGETERTPRETNEGRDATESSERQALDDATLNPRTSIEQGGDFRQAEQVQEAFSVVMVNAGQQVEHQPDGAEYSSGHISMDPAPITVLACPQETVRNSTAAGESQITAADLIVEETLGGTVGEIGVASELGSAGSAASGDAGAASELGSAGSAASGDAGAASELGSAGSAASGDAGAASEMGSAGSAATGDADAATELGSAGAAATGDADAAAELGSAGNAASGDAVVEPESGSAGSASTGITQDRSASLPDNRRKMGEEETSSKESTASGSKQAEAKRQLRKMDPRIRPTHPKQK